MLNVSRSWNSDFNIIFKTNLKFMEGIAFQACTINDCNVLTQIGIRTFREAYEPVEDPVQFQIYIDEAYDEDKISLELQNPESGHFFLKKENEIAGYLKVNIGESQTEEMGEEYLEVQRIYLLKKFYRQGLGTVLIQKAIELAKQKGKTKIWLGVWEENHRALSFYRNMGFVKTGSHAFFVGNMEEIDFIMELEV